MRLPTFHRKNQGLTKDRGLSKVTPRAHSEVFFFFHSTLEQLPEQPFHVTENVTKKADRGMGGGKQGEKKQPWCEHNTHSTELPISGTQSY